MIYFFWGAILLLIYHYLLFPCITFLLAITRGRPIKRGDYEPKVSLIIAAYNEERILKQKLENTLALDYPPAKLEVIVVADGSTDATATIAESFASQGVTCLYEPPRRGKTAALNRAVAIATGEIILFSDANSMYPPQTVQILMRNFADQTVGGVCGRKSIVDNITREASRGDNIYWNFESAIKIKQSLIGSITTGDGEIFAIRRNLYEKIPEEIINDDTAITFTIIRKGLRVVYEPQAVSLEEASLVLEDDFNVKVRMVAGGYQTLAYFHDLLFPPQDFFALQFLSHKVLRWFMPFLLATILLTNFFMTGALYRGFLILQILCYAAALMGLLLHRRKTPLGAALYIPLYYCTMNLAAFWGFIAFLRRQRGVDVWKKAAR